MTVVGSSVIYFLLQSVSSSNLDLPSKQPTSSKLFWFAKKSLASIGSRQFRVFEVSEERFDLWGIRMAESGGGGGGWRDSYRGMSSDNIKGLVLAISSSLFIGASFIVKKKGLKKAGASGVRAGFFFLF